MTTRVRRPTDEAATEVFDPTDVTERPGLAAVEHPTPTRIDPAPGDAASLGGAHPSEAGVPVGALRGAARSEPIRVISMKDRPDAETPWPDVRVPVHVQLRSIAEVARRHDTPVGLGNLAPPRDPRQARARRIRSNAVWACIALALAAAISLAIWLVAGR